MIEALSDAFAAVHQALFETLVEPAMYALGVLVAAGGAALVSLALYLIFKNSVAVLARLGKVGTLVMIRMMAFILLCIGIQIIWTGWAELNGIAS